jgi:hypothetical protein
MADKIKIDGRKMRWFDCDWSSDDNIPTGCGVCKICRYHDFLDFAHSVGKPEESAIDYNRKLDKYIDLETREERQEFYLNSILTTT